MYTCTCVHVCECARVRLHVNVHVRVCARMCVCARERKCVRCVCTASGATTRLLRRSTSATATCACRTPTTPACARVCLLCAGVCARVRVYTCLCVSVRVHGWADRVRCPQCDSRVVLGDCAFVARCVRARTSARVCTGCEQQCAVTPNPLAPTPSCLPAAPLGQVLVSDVTLRFGHGPQLAAYEHVTHSIRDIEARKAVSYGL